MKIGVLLMLIGLATACSSDPAKPASSAEKVAQTDSAKDGVICTYEKAAGSYLKEKKCTTPAQREVARQQNGSLDVRNARDSGVQ